MFTAILIAFIVGYVLIVLEHNIHIDKAATALVTGIICWIFVIFGGESIVNVTQFGTPSGAGFDHDLEHYIIFTLGEIAQVLFFLLASMTSIVLIDAHEGFSIITERIKANNIKKLYWTIGIITFCLSLVLDNMSTSILMIALISKLIPKKELLWLFGGMIVIAANLGGACSPIGDTTTIYLWLQNTIDTTGIIKMVFVPAFVALVTTLFVGSMFLKSSDELAETSKTDGLDPHIPHWEKTTFFIVGLGSLLSVPVLKLLFDIPPFMGMLLTLGMLWVVSERFGKNRDHEEKHALSVTSALKTIDTNSILFFLGILMAVAALQTAGHLGILSAWLSQTFPNMYAQNIIIGGLSAVMDNVPLVVAATKMYFIKAGTPYAHGGDFWNLLAFCAGTGGSLLIIGSAAGIALMGILKIPFFWYAKRISFLALIAYVVGIAMYAVMTTIM
jgi:Na+/H+ antiporter NhaD/arsenite permease-like protein